MSSKPRTIGEIYAAGKKASDAPGHEWSQAIQTMIENENTIRSGPADRITALEAENARLREALGEVKRLAERPFQFRAALKQADIAVLHERMMAITGTARAALGDDA